MPEQNSSSSKTKPGQLPQNDGGLYKHLNISVKMISTIIIVGLIALAALVVLGSQSEGIPVRYDSRGGSDVEIQHYEFLEPLTKPEDPTREGYHFEGWAYDEACLAPVEFGGQVEQELEFYACWQEK
ncbi:InlB B-repeat-containing protein [Erysipelotrichaceae bacterium RD49]|nr:InlB B-repeat-containing protein [Erysipelotrichaceae bacterium RD49]